MKARIEDQPDVNYCPKVGEWFRTKHSWNPLFRIYTPPCLKEDLNVVWYVNTCGEVGSCDISTTIFQPLIPKGGELVLVPG
jgi:hypothetical protein